MRPDFFTLAETLRDDLIATRRDFHQHPELAFEEIRTSRIVAEELQQLGLEVQTGVGKTGVVGILEGNQPGKTVLLRADMDALPIQEANEADYASTVPGIMHACGHDGHTAMALGLARLISPLREQLHGRIKFVFQPAEEVGGGARAMVTDGVLDDPQPDVSLGMHLWNELPVGTYGIIAGAMMAGASDVRIRITGKGGHGAIPHQTIDPVLCAAHVLVALQSVVSRNIDPMETAVLSITQLQAGQAFNVIPHEAELIGTFRVFSLEMRELVESRVRTLASSICEGMGCVASVSIQHYTDPVVNDATVAAQAQNTAQRVLGANAPIFDIRTMAAEDVHLFMDDIPGLYFFVGSANPEKELDYPHHHERFDFDEQALVNGVGLMAHFIADYVWQDADES